MDQHNRNNYNEPFDTRQTHGWKRSDDLGVYGPDRIYRDYNDRNIEPGIRTYAGSSASNYGGTYDTSHAWPDRDMHGYRDDRNMFERMGDRIRDTWNDWTAPDRREGNRYYRNNTYRGSWDDNRSQRYGREEKNIFERAGEKVRDFFRPSGEGYSSGRYRYDNERSQDYGRTGFGAYGGSYGAYTGVHGVTGYNTGTRDNYTTDYDRPYRPHYDNDMYREDDMNRRYGQRDGRYNYRAGDYGQVEVGEFRARERYNMRNPSRFRDDYRR